MHKTFATLLTILLTVGSVRAADDSVFRSGNEDIIQIANLDLLRQSHKQLDATVRGDT